MKLAQISASVLFVASVFTSPITITSAIASDLTTPSPKGALAYIVSPKNGETVDGTFTVIFGLAGMGIAPAGVEQENTGHHHLLVDQENLPAEGVPMGSPPIHFGKGQTEAEVTLEPGTHTLQLIMGNHFHVPHNPPVVSEKITITVADT